MKQRSGRREGHGGTCQELKRNRGACTSQQRISRRTERHRAAPDTRPFMTQIAEIKSEAVLGRAMRVDKDVGDKDGHR